MCRPSRAVDIHAHCLVEAVEGLVATHEGRARELAWQASLMGTESVRHNLALMASQWREHLTDVDTRLRLMDAMRIDVQAVSISPTQYYYWAEPELAESIVRVANEGVAALCARRPDRLVGLGTVALQHPELAAAQIDVAMRSLGLRGAIISTAIAGVELSDTRLDPFWAAAERLAALIFIHPFGCALGARLAPHYLSNVIGQPLETTVALSHLIFGGVLDRFPRLRICAAHGGGYLPFYIGRSDHAYEVRPESRTPEHPPSEYLGRLWFDSLVYRPDTLRHLIDRVGCTQVLLGTDYPFDMGVQDPLDRLAAVPRITHPEIEAIGGATASRLLGFEEGA